MNNPDEVPTFLNHILPEWLLSNARVEKINSWLKGKKKKRKVRLVIFVDDLDRCPPAKCVEVLQSLVLLTENTPFIVFLAIDPRIVVQAIEVDNQSFFGDAGINGYEYLDKIVQVRAI